jgi:hypothetical protein
MSKLIFVAFILATYGIAEGQSSNLELTNSKPLDVDRYKGVKGSPYLFEDWKLAKIMNEDLRFIDDVLVNYNGLTQEFEVTDGTSYIQLDERAHSRIEVWDEHAKEFQVFIKVRSYGAAANYGQMHFSSKSIMWLSTFTAKIEERKIETPGKTELIKNFATRVTNYFVLDNSAIEFRMKKKRILEALSVFPEASKITNEMKLNIEKEEDLIKLLNELD